MVYVEYKADLVETESAKEKSGKWNWKKVQSNFTGVSIAFFLYICFVICNFHSLSHHCVYGWEQVLSHS